MEMRFGAKNHSKDFWLRRRKQLIIPFLVISLLALGIALWLPPVYTSKVSLLVEHSQVPGNLVDISFSEFVEHRVQYITQKIMSRSNLLNIIKKYNLYSNMRADNSMQQIVDKMRDDITLETVSSQLINKSTSKPMDSIIAFSISYEGEQPLITQKVASELASLYLSENEKQTKQAVSSTTTFLEKELKSLNDKIVRSEIKLAAFKEEHVGEMPDDLVIIVEAIREYGRGIAEVNQRMNSLKDRRIYLKSQLALTEPVLPQTEAPAPRYIGKKTDVNTKLEDMKLNYLELAATVSEKHPDMIKMDKELQELEDKVNQKQDLEGKLSLLEELKAEVILLRAKFSDKHPDVKKMERDVILLQEDIDNLKQDGFLATETKEEAQEQEVVYNPVYLSLNDQITALEIEIKSLMERSDELRILR